MDRVLWTCWHEDKSYSPTLCLFKGRQDWGVCACAKKNSEEEKKKLRLTCLAQCVKHIFLVPPAWVNNGNIGDKQIRRTNKAAVNIGLYSVRHDCTLSPGRMEKQKSRNMTLPCFLITNPQLQFMLLVIDACYCCFLFGLSRVWILAFVSMV